MERIRSILRWFLAAVCGGLVLAIIGAVVSEFFIETAREHGYYTHASERLDAAMSAFSAFVTQPWFLAAAVGCAGVTIGLWADWGLRKVEVIRRKKNATTKERLHDLYLRVEEIKQKLLEDEITFKNKKANFDSFHEASALMVHLLQIGVPVPLMPEYEEIVQYETFTEVVYKYFSAISPFLRDGDLDLTRIWAAMTLKTLKARIERNGEPKHPQE
jgi:hypothetical protein